MPVRNDELGRSWIRPVLFSLTLLMVTIGFAVSGVFVGASPNLSANHAGSPANYAVKPSANMPRGNAPLAPLANIVVNGGFETGLLSPQWAAISPAAGSITNTVALVHGGTFASRIAFTTNSATAGLAGGGGCAGGSRMAVTANTSYTWTGWIRRLTNL